MIDRVLDAASGTFGVRLELSNPGYRLAAGVRCTASFPGISVAHKSRGARSVVPSPALGRWWS